MSTLAVSLVNAIHTIREAETICCSYCDDISDFQNTTDKCGVIIYYTLLLSLVPRKLMLWVSP